MKLLRTVHGSRQRHNQTFTTVQVGSFDGFSNDVFATTFLKPAAVASTPLSMSNWKGVLVEPVYMDRLRSTYGSYERNSDIDIANIKFIESVISNDCSTTDSGRKVSTFFKVERGRNCNSRNLWLDQISGLNESLLRAELKGKYTDCVTEHKLPCSTVIDLLKEALLERMDLELPSDRLCCSSVTANMDNSGRQKCTLPNRDGEIVFVPLPWIDAFIIDAEGADAAIVDMILTELCPALWPATIVYEDKVGRYHGLDMDGVLLKLAHSGYYTMLVGEDVIAIKTLNYYNKYFNQMTTPKRYRQRCCRNVSIF